MILNDLRSLAIARGAIGFNYDEAGDGTIDWYQLVYDWQAADPKTQTISVEAPIEVQDASPPIQLQPFTPPTYKFELRDIPSFIHQFSAYARNIPPAMKAENRWCVWKRLDDGRKIPYRVLDSGYWSLSERCKSDDSRSWTSFESALFCFMNANGHLGGISFALGDGWCGFDFDNVIQGGKMHPQAKSWLTRLGGYSEVSQSHSGQKTILRGTLSKDFLGTAETGRQFKGIPAAGMATEVYDRRRFFFLTGHGSGEPTPNPRAIEAICSELVARKTAQNPPKPKAQPRQKITPAMQLSDTEILEKIQASRQAEKFNSLWNGNIGLYDSHSEADMALTSLLMWWTNNNTAQVLRLFEQSGLANRYKWNRDDYRERTLAKAERSEGYTPHLPRNYADVVERIRGRLNNGK